MGLVGLRIRRRRLRKWLIAVGCVVAAIDVALAAIGGALILSGSVVHFWSKAFLEQNRRLITAGPYRWSRNPFYLANLLIDLGLCFVIGRWWLVMFFLPIWIVSYRDTIAREERRLLGLFPYEFPRYREAVPKLIPTGRRLGTEQATGVFSLANPALAKGSEYARLLGIWLAPFVIWAAETLRSERLGLFEAPNAIILTLIVSLIGLWVIKLAVAESFRRPQTALLPFPESPWLRQGVMFGLCGMVYLLGQPFAITGPILWGLLLALDHSSRFRAAERAISIRPLWRFFQSSPRVVFSSR
ncbi:MAG: isoprenylcysteine carboxylmethyltransferase family protein [Myxococcota bacterium]